uniref:Uncharacterized protein LOC111104011 isoform X3 n=1 Tax=Crassostrea virginica TaxID=6565 RepID=A0A8B8AQK4_CRAVI|nr:uncharacterized protein LOC111104011 isoform X3 [Crassostrea virginica]
MVLFRMTTSTGAMSRRSLLALVILAILVQGSLQQYGHLEDPPARGSMWRYGFNTPVNSEDNSMNCGGKQVHTRNRLQCGVCGDSYDGPRAHEYGGRLLQDSYQNPTHRDRANSSYSSDHKSQVGKL